MEVDRTASPTRGKLLLGPKIKETNKTFVIFGEKTS